MGITPATTIAASSSGRRSSSNRGFEKLNGDFDENHSLTAALYHLILFFICDLM